LLLFKEKSTQTPGHGMSRPVTGGVDVDLDVDVDHVCDYFGGDHDMASMFLDMLNSDVKSGSTSEVHALLRAPVRTACSCADRAPASTATCLVRSGRLAPCRPLRRSTFAATSWPPAAFAN